MNMVRFNCFLFLLLFFTYTMRLRIERNVRSKRTREHETLSVYPRDYLNSLKRTACLGGLGHRVEDALSLEGGASM
jgi:hypothetical protein